MPETVALFTGLFRHRDMFERQLAALRRDALVDRIVFSTWTDDFEAHASELAALAQRYDLEIHHRAQPPVTHGNFLHQMCALEHGLAQIHPDDLVLKTRTDILIDAAAIRHMIAKDRSLTSSFLRDILPFRSKISVTETQLSGPFIYDDIFFCGRAGDIRYFVNLDLTFEHVYKSNDIVHERYWGTFFDRIFPFLHGYYRNSWILSGDSGIPWTRVFGIDYKFQMTRFAVNDPDFAMMMALSFLVTDDAFTADWGAKWDFFHFKGTWGEFHGPRWGGRSFAGCETLDEVFALDRFSPQHGMISCNDDAFFSRITQGTFAKGRPGDRIADCAAAILESGSIDPERLADMDAFSRRALAYSKDVVHRLVPQCQTKAFELVKAGRKAEAELLLKQVIDHLSAS